MCMVVCFSLVDVRVFEWCVTSQFECQPSCICLLRNMSEGVVHVSPCGCLFVFTCACVRCALCSF